VSKISAPLWEECWIFFFQGGKDVDHDVAQSDDHANAVGDQVAPVLVNKASSRVTSVAVSTIGRSRRRPTVSAIT
jgi:hypothetical protein